MSHYRLPPIAGDTSVQVYDLRDEPHQLEPREWNPRTRRDPSQIAGVVLHQWAAKVSTAPSQSLKYGEAEALARRSLAVPYGICCGVTERGGVPIVAVAHPLERYTNASDAGNRHWISIGVMGLFPFTEDRRAAGRHTVTSDALRAAACAALAVAVALLEEADGVLGEASPASRVPLSLITHRQCANGQNDHFLCPGEAVVEMALTSKPVRDGVLVPEPDRVLLPDYGKPWPEEWRRHLRPRQIPLAINERPSVATSTASAVP